MNTYKFSRGGISFEDPNAPAADKSVLAFLPSISVVPLKQHSGSPACPLVRVGDTIREGELLARPQDSGGADIHAPIPGEIVQTCGWDTPPAQKNEAFVIKFKGGFEILGKKREEFPWENLSPFEIRALINEAGVVEMSGSERPLQSLFVEKLNEARMRTLVVRCVFDDPWLVADAILCRERASAVVEGASIAARAVEADRIIFAVSKNRKETGKALLEEAKKRNAAATAVPAAPAVTLVQVGSRYPQHGRREMEIALRKYEKKTLESLGALLFIDPACLTAVYDAVKLRKPLVSRYVAVGGSAVRYPAVINARIGTRVGELFQQCGGFKKEPEYVGFGSTLLGQKASSLNPTKRNNLDGLSRPGLVRPGLVRPGLKKSGLLQPSLDEPITKTTYAVFAESASPFSFLKKIPFITYDKREKHDRSGTSCINCGLCRTVCPVGLDPDGICKRLTTSDYDEAYSHLIAQCHGCACCEAVCPSRLPLCTVIKGFVPSASRSVSSSLSLPRSPFKEQPR
ncbi:MAG: SLBB domain-containing protein [Spirochaetaceae bacterium]|jgi:electron transport complex protein RnfC|nr:SLBB domain-containing protein [Spirochaetaceae bacterium]